MVESEMECFSGVKTAQNSKKEGGIERKKKHENVKLKEDVLGNFTSRKTRRMQIRVLSEFNVKLAFRNKRT